MEFKKRERGGKRGCKFRDKTKPESPGEREKRELGVKYAG